MEARDLFAQALTLEETAEALEGYGLSCWWLEEVASMFDYRERAFRLYRARGDSRSAARVATALGVDYADFRGELAVGNGWLERAESLLESVDECAEHGWLALNRGIVRIIFEGDIIGAREQQQKALEIGRRLDIFDLRMLALTLDGLIMVREGNVAEGMRRMDEATAAAVSGEMTDLSAISNACCALIYACEAVADYDRAVQWCNRAKEFSQRWGPASLFAICRSYYATVLVWQGAWTEAEAELTAAAQELEASRRSNALEGLAKLGDLRRRQGRHAEAEDLLRRAETHPMALLGKAALALEKSDPDSALDLVRRFLRRITDEDQAERVFALEIAVRARLAGGDIDGAQSDLAEAVSITTLVGTQSLRASSSMSAGLVALAFGDLDRAKDSFEDAIDLFESTGNSFDGGRARLELATTLSRVGRQDAAMQQAKAALEAFERLGAAFQAQITARIVRGSETTLPGQSHPPLPGLTARESEVLWLLVEGKTNQEIAEHLVLSVRTVERHISTIYEKLDLHGKAARAAATAFALRHVHGIPGISLA